VTVLADDCRNSPAAWTSRAKLAEPWAAAGWSRESQETRFSAIIDALAPKKGESMLDYGCGPGVLSDLMTGPHIVASGRIDYLGFDWSLGMVERAKREHPDVEFTTMLRDGDTWDLVVCCGTFNLRDNWSKLRTWAMLRMLWNRCTRAMAVSLYCGTDPACLRYEPSEVARLAGELSPSFSVERGYLPNDLLLVLRR
jgi:SAM-dependent methyltransferase